MARVWWQKTSVYHIYPRSFFDTNGDGIGDIEGVIRKLDYIKALGVETVWLSPFFKSPQGDIGYDVADYKKIDSDYGKPGDIERLIREVHKRKMKIVFDLVLNHTSDQHNWFIESRSSRDNEKRRWYIWRDGRKPGGKKPPNNWKSLLGEPAWKYDKNTDQWYYHHFFNFQPDLNYRHPEVKREMLNILRYWLRQGVNGFRLDILYAIYSDPLFRDNPRSWRYVPTDKTTEAFFQEHRYDLHLKETFDFAKEIRAVCNEFGEDRFAVGEVFGSTSQVAKYYGRHGQGLNMCFVFEFASERFSAKKYYRVIEELENEIPYPKLPALAYSNHDRPRMFTRLGNHLEKARLMAVMQFTLRGIPFVYYGEEIGMRSIKVRLKDSHDPIGRSFSWMPRWLSDFVSDKLGLELTRDTVRSPMQWNAGSNAGFTEAPEPWLPVHKNFNDVNVEAAQENPRSLYHLYKHLAHIRQHFPAFHGRLKLGDQSLTKKKVLTYERYARGGRFRVFLNFGREPVKVAAEAPFALVLSTLSYTKDDPNIGPGWIKRHANDVNHRSKMKTELLLGRYEAQIHYLGPE